MSLPLDPENYYGDTIDEMITPVDELDTGTRIGIADQSGDEEVGHAHDM